MAYAIHENKRIFYNNKTITAKPPENIGKPLWNGVDQYVRFSQTPSITGSVKAEFYLTISPNIPDKPVTVNAYVLQFEPGQIDMMLVDLYVSNSGSSILMNVTQETSSPVHSKAVQVAQHRGEEIFVEIFKTTKAFPVIKINDIVQPLVAVSGVMTNYPHVYIGPNQYSHEPVETFTIRDIKLYTNPDTTNELAHHWQGYGYPKSNINEAWKDLVGNVDGSVMGNPELTRY